MTLTVRIPPDLEDRLKNRAAGLGLDEEEYVKRLIEQDLPTGRQITDQATLDLLARWDHEDATDDPVEIEKRHQEWEEFRRAMNEDSLSGRPVYP